MFQAYLITSLVTGKSYVGITSRPLKQRWAEHLYDARNRHAKMAISRAIAKHGANNFEILAVCSAYSWAAICDIETALIVQHNTRAPSGYNLSDGGEGPFGVKKTAESIERSAAKHRGKSCHPNTRLAASLFHRGRPKSAQMRARVAAAIKGKPRSEATKRKIRAYWAMRRASGEFKSSAPYAHYAKSSSRYIAQVYKPT